MISCCRTAVIGFVMVGLAGCAAGVTRAPGTEQTRPVVKALQGFTVELSPQAKSQLPDNIKFDPEALKGTLGRTLDARQLLAADGDFKLQVVVNDVRVRSTFNAVFWGFMAGDDHVEGNAVLFDRTGRQVYAFAAKASYALGGIGGGQDSSRMNWLYEEFSKVIADELQAKRDEKK